MCARQRDVKIKTTWRCGDERTQGNTSSFDLTDVLDEGLGGAGEQSFRGVGEDTKSRETSLQAQVSFMQERMGT